MNQQHYLKVLATKIDTLTDTVQNNGSGVQDVLVTNVTAIPIAGDVNATCSGTVAVSGISGTTTIAGDVNATCSGTVAVSAIAGTTTISGNVNATCSGTVAVSSIAGTTAISGNVNATCSGTVAVSSIAGTPNVNLLSSTITLPISNTPLTNLDTNIASVMAVGALKVNVQTMPSVAITNQDLTDLGNCVDTVNSHLETDLNALNGVTLAVNSGAKSDGCQRICVATDDVNMSNLTTQWNQKVRQTRMGLESSDVSEWQLQYKSTYPNAGTVFNNYFESFSTNCTWNAADGGIKITPTSAPTAVSMCTRFNFINGMNGWLIIFTNVCANSTGDTASLEVGIQYYNSSGYISILNDYAAGVEIKARWVVGGAANNSAGTSMSAWNIDTFNGSGTSGIDLATGNNRKQPIRWFILLSAQGSYAYVGVVHENKLRAGHGFSTTLTSVVSDNNSGMNQHGFRPFYRNNTTTAAQVSYFGGFEIYSKLGNYMNITREPFQWYQQYTMNASTTIYPLAIFWKGSNLSTSYISLKSINVRTTGTSDIGDYRVEIWHTVDNQWTIVGGTTVNNISSNIIHSMTSITGGKRIHVLQPNSDTCLYEDLSWIDHKHFGIDIAFTSGWISIIYFIVINISASVNKQCYFNVSWSE